MQLSFVVPTPLQYFSALVQSGDSLPLLETAASIAQDDYPALDMQGVLAEVDELLARLKRRIAPDAPPLQTLRLLNQYFFRELSFGGNVNHYDDPGNSYIHRVLKTRRGIPISLAVLWMELAQGVGLNVSGVGFPGHFLIKVSLPKGQVVIDPFTGQSLGREELSERLDAFRPRPSTPMEDDVPLGLYLQAAAPREIIARMLRNLKHIHRTQEDWDRMIGVENRLITLLPDAWSEYRDRGLAHAEQGRSAHAVHDLETYLGNTDETQDVLAIAGRVAELRRNGM